MEQVIKTKLDINREVTKCFLNNIDLIINKFEKIDKIIVFGRSSVGKSTFINNIVNNKILETGVGGITKEPIILTSIKSFKDKNNYTSVNIDIINFKLVIDTPGIDSGIKFNFKNLAELSDLIIFVADCQQGITKEDFNFFKSLKKLKKKFIIVLSKIDLELKFLIKNEQEVIFDLLNLKNNIKNILDIQNIFFFTNNLSINETYFEVLNNDLYK